MPSIPHTPTPRADLPLPAPIHLEPWVVLVTGSHLSAETFDRPIAYRLRESIVRRLRDDEVDHAEARVVVCSDLWYLNQPHLRALPTISLGGPNVSALSAYLADRLPSVLAVDRVMLIQMDAHAEPPVASIWGIDASSTAGAADAFAERFLDDFLASLPA